jgi:hypothetical protein
MDLPRNAPEVLQRRAYPALKRREFLEETCKWYTPYPMCFSIYQLCRFPSSGTQVQGNEKK